MFLTVLAGAVLGWRGYAGYWAGGAWGVSNPGDIATALVVVAFSQNATPT